MGQDWEVALKQAHGNWVTGDRFWDREVELQRFIERIDEGANLLLVAQRRIGKTSLMREAVCRISQRYVCLFVDLQKAMTAPDAVVELSIATQPYEPLWKKSVDLFSNILGSAKAAVDSVNIGLAGIKLRASLSGEDWLEKGDQLFKILSDSSQPVVILFDEIPILVNRMLKDNGGSVTDEGRRQVDRFMSWLRDNSIRHKGKVHIVLSGSIGLEPVLNQANLSATLNTFSPFELKPWDEDTAVGCLCALAEEYGVQFGEGAALEMVHRLGCCIPHHVQMFFTYVYDRCRLRGRMDFYKDEVDEVYRCDMLSVRGHAELTHYEERLQLMLGTNPLPLALEMLTESAVSGTLSREAIVALGRIYNFPGRTTDQVQREILLVLEHDGYLQRTDQGYTFVSRLVRDWWKRRYEGFFTPVLERGS